MSSSNNHYTQHRPLSSTTATLLHTRTRMDTPHQVEVSSAKLQLVLVPTIINDAAAVSRVRPIGRTRSNHS
eukprot:scaffold8984_cov128-Skeletonema_marinoi.AAC.1